VATVLGVVPKLRAQLPALRAAVVQFDFELVSSLEEWALVLNKLHAAALIPEERSPISAAEIAEARQLRRLLHSDGLGLVKRGLLSQSDLESIGQSSGFVNLARDLNQLHRLFTANAHSLSGRCAVSEPELSRALELANRLTKLIAQRAHPTPHKGAELERRAYTKLLAAYREARSGILFLRRHEGDGDDIIPSLFIGRGGRGANAKSATNARNRQTAASDASSTESLYRPFETVGSPTSAPNERKKKQ
jgi:hypothetical protein